MGVCGPGTFHRDREPGAAALYRLDPGGELALVLPDRTISNGIGWSLDGTTMYYIDSITQRVAAFAYDLDTGGLGEQRTFTEIDPADGLPDGLTVDAEGGVWVCLFGGGRVRRYLPDGRLDQEIMLPLDQSDVPRIRREGPTHPLHHDRPLPAQRRAAGTRATRRCGAAARTGRRRSAAVPLRRLSLRCPASA